MNSKSLMTTEEERSSLNFWEELINVVLSPQDLTSSLEYQSPKFHLIMNRTTNNGQTISFLLDNSDSWLLQLLMVNILSFFIHFFSIDERSFLIFLGIMDHEEAKKKHTGGKILGFFY